MVRVVKFVDGEPSIIQAENSQIKLHVPKGVYGAILANIHTNYARFLHHIPDDDCLVSPICEYHLQKPYQELILGKTIEVKFLKPRPDGVKYRIQIPHIVKDVDKVQSLIRVRHGNLHNDVLLEKLSPQTQGGNISLDVNEEFVTINTNHFTGYIVTAKHINCCGKSANIHVFGSLRNIPKARPLATVKVYLSSIHSNIKDYQFVSISVEINIRSVKNTKVSELMLELNKFPNKILC